MLKCSVTDSSFRSAGAEPRSCARSARAGIVCCTATRLLPLIGALIRFCTAAWVGGTEATKSARAKGANREHKRLYMIRSTLLKVLHHLELRARWSPSNHRPDKNGLCAIDHIEVKRLRRSP